MVEYYLPAVTSLHGIFRIIFFDFFSKYGNRGPFPVLQHPYYMISYGSDLVNSQ